MIRQSSATLWRVLSVLLFGYLVPISDASDVFLKPVQIGEISRSWRSRGSQPLTESERAEILQLGELSVERAIPRLGWLMVERRSEEVRQLAREIILGYPDWRDFISDRLASAAQFQLPAELFGGDLDSLYEKVMADESIPVEERRKSWSELRENFENASSAY